MGRNTPWPQNQIAELLGLLKESPPLSAAKIGQRMGKNKNQIIGKLHRMGLSTGNVPKSPRANHDRRSWYGPRLSTGNVPKSPRANHDRRSWYGPRLSTRSRPLPKPAPSPIEALLIDGRHVELMDLNNSRCRFPLGDPQAKDFHFCGHEPEPTKVYCPYHQVLTHGRTPEVATA